MISRMNRQRGLIALVQILGLAVWFSASAVVPTLRLEWGISSAEAVWLTASVQVGFVAGALTSTVLNLADRIRPQLLLATSAAGAAACTVTLAVFVDGLSAAIPLRFLTGVFLAGVYPVGMKLMASWSPSESRGKAFGVLIGALTLGSALPQLISGIGTLPWQQVMGTAAAITTLGALIAAAGVRPGPYLDTQPIKPNPRYALEMFKERGPRLANLGHAYPVNSAGSSPGTVLRTPWDRVLDPELRQSCRAAIPNSGGVPGPPNGAPLPCLGAVTTLAGTAVSSDTVKRPDWLRPSAPAEQTG